MTTGKTIACVVVDDEPLALKLIADYVQKTPFLQLREQTGSPMRAIELVQQGEAELLFLDIQMPELTGLQLMKIVGHKCKVIITTAYTDYAMDGYEFDVVDYLLKPITFDRFLVAAHKVRERMLNEPVAPLQEATPSPAPSSPGYIFVKTEYKIQKIDLTSILYLEGLRDYVAFYTQSGKVLTLQSLRSFQDQLPELQFMRVHKSYLIALDKIEFIERNRIIIAGNYIPIGETYQDAFLQRLNIR
ncbi:LytTR family DNA-binding domain-containing protein [Paraflavitalea sp. CAU 1676]|uniref:LytR/AlgR family response regulator transcription factor n=1 Tax=Paraflavitalea sp. CAU 1676 TaxID=3032598 RepID=UPI0023DB12E7|nr:LytTR family DNA-binding domain-containing protein [Paraflavitalea sp. CAU 1676]MDF2190708.1 LytTR family DNA-binding domain-containing protein [Paraflavitalea sp. CAU 1676]